MECDVAGYHISSFNYFCGQGLQKAIEDVPIEKM